MSEHVITAGPAFKETRQSGPFTETVTSAENVNIPTHPAPNKTLEQHQADFNAWLKERGLTLAMIAIGRKHGEPADIREWEPATHKFTTIVVEARHAGNR